MRNADPVVRASIAAILLRKLPPAARNATLCRGAPYAGFRQYVSLPPPNGTPYGCRFWRREEVIEKRRPGSSREHCGNPFAQVVPRCPQCDLRRIALSPSVIYFLQMQKALQLLLQRFLRVSPCQTVFKIFMTHDLYIHKKATALQAAAFFLQIFYNLQCSGFPHLSQNFPFFTFSLQFGQVTKSSPPQ